LNFAILRWVTAIILALTLQAAPIVSVNADMIPLVASTPDHVAIQGYDTVAYFTDGMAVPGSNEFEYYWDDAIWRFASAEHRDLFAADPDKYMPQYGGYCAGGMAMGVSVPANPTNWAIVDGKLYMVSGGPADLSDFQQHAADNITNANKHWTEATGAQN